MGENEKAFEVAKSVVWTLVMAGMSDNDEGAKTIEINATLADHAVAEFEKRFGHLKDL